MGINYSDNMEHEIDIKKYATFFHDGEVREINHVKNDLELWMESAQLISEWNEDNVALSKRDTISGKLHLIGPKRIKENENTNLEIFKIKSGYENGTVYRFSIDANTISLQIWWMKYSPEYEESGTFRYEIEAEKIYWENIPTLFDDYWDSL